MKYILRILLFISVLLLGLGFYIKNSKDYSQGELLIGISVMIMAVIIMPLFIFSMIIIPVGKMGPVSIQAIHITKTMLMEQFGILLP